MFAKAQRGVARARSRTDLDFSTLAFGEQWRAISCHARMVLLTCSGRAGKTRAFLLKWLEVCQRKPGAISAFVALTLKSARLIAWLQLKRMNIELSLGLTFKDGDLLQCTHPNGSMLVLLGANREDLIDVLRGFPLALIGFDEAAFFSEGLLKRAIEDAILMRLFDLDGELWVMGTPGYVKAGYHYDAGTGEVKGFTRFHWTYFDNPHLPEDIPGQPKLTPAQKAEARREWGRTQRAERGWTEETPSYMREFLGRYAQDTDALVYAFDRGVHMIDELPASFMTDRQLWRFVLGMDFGSTNATAWHLWGIEKNNPIAYGIKSLKHFNMAPSLCADVTKQWIDDWNPDVIVGDSAAKGYIDEHREQHGIAIQLADKQHKRAHQITMNDAFRAVPVPRIRLLRGACDDYASELERLGKNPKYDTHHPKYGEEDPRGEKDLCDAGLYGYNEAYAWVEEILARQAAADRAAWERDHASDIDPDPEDRLYRDPEDELARYMG